jgi:hypothetical protein
MSPRPYQSRLFNFLNQQSLQMRDRLGEAVRHLKVAAEWGVQALIYPFYQILQASLKTGNKFAAADRLQLPPESASESTELLCNRPIGRILRVLEPLFERVEAAEAPAKPIPWWSRLVSRPPTARQAPVPTLPAAVEPTLSLQGIATLLPGRRLVLVAADNQIQDLLSDRQQQKLKTCIHRVMADYHYQYRRLLAPQKKILGLIPQAEADRDRPLPPLDFVWQVWRWVQYQPAAIALEQWRDGRLAASSPVPAKPAIALERGRHRRIASHLAQTSQGIVATERLPSVPFTELSRVVAAAVNYFFGTTAQTTLPASAESLAAASLVQSPALVRTAIALQQNLSALPRVLGDRALGDRLPSEPDPFPIHQLLQAAVDYFFGEERRYRAISNSPPSVRISSTPARTPLPSAAEQAIADPWLMWEDLFPEAIAQPATRPTFPGAATLPIAESPIPHLPQSVPLSQAPAAQALEKSARKSPKIIRRRPAGQARGAIATPPVSAKSGSMDFEPDWIEISSQPIGYVRHPLEILLNAFDRVIFAVEKIFSWLWQSLQWLVPNMQVWLNRIFQTMQSPSQRE